MSIQFPLSPTRNVQQNWHSIEFRRLAVVDFILESLARGNSISIYADAFQTWDGIEEIQELASLEKNEMVNTDFFSNTLSIRKDVKEILDAVSHSKDALFGKQTFWELASLFHSSPTSNSKSALDEVFDISDFEFDVESYKKTKKDLRKASELYSSELLYQVSKSALRTSSFIKDEQDVNLVAFRYVDSFLKRAEEICHSLHAFFAKNHSIREKEYIKYAIDLRLVGLKNSVVQPSTHVSLMEHLERSKHAFADKVKKESVMLNSRNTGDEEVKNVEIDLSELIKDINSSQLFKEEVNIHTLSLTLKLDAVKQLVSQLNDAAFELREDGELSTWFNFYDNICASSKTLINALKSENKDHWEAIYDTWFLRNMLIVKGLLTQQSIFSKIENIKENWERIRFDFVDIAKMLMNEKGCTLTILPLSEISRHNSGNALILDEIPDTDWQELSMKSGLYFGLKPKGNRSFTGDDALHESLLTAYDEDELESKLLKSKLLATYFVDNAERVELLIAPDGNVIVDSSYSDVSGMVKDSLNNYKQVKMRDNGFKVLTEFFLNEADRNYYYYDQTALNFETAEDIYKHISKINALQTAGYYTISIDRNQLSNPSYISHLLSEEIIQNA